MLPHKMPLKGVALGLLVVLCVSSEFVAGGSLRSNILSKVSEKSTKTKAIDCYSCDSVAACSLRDFKWIQCDNYESQDATDATVATSQCMTIFNKAGFVQQRGCRRELSKKFESYCNQNPAKCSQCDGERCNNQPQQSLPSLKMKKSKAAKTISTDAVHQCFKCISEDDCAEEGEVVDCPNQEEALCYVKFNKDNSAIGMGCKSDFENELEIINLIKQKQLYMCEGDVCNHYENWPLPNECSVCKSDQADTCATDPSVITASKICSAVPNTQCYQRVNNDTDGLTERGCLTDLEGDDVWDCVKGGPNDKCQVCIGAGCNKSIVPENRRKCHRCQSDENASCEANPDDLSICPVYNKEESCAAVYDSSSGVTRRGCFSELPCNANDRSCQVCKGEGCNTANVKKRSEEFFGIFQDLPLNCNTCEGEECSSGIRNPRKCEGDPYQDCLTVFDAAGKILRRGCESAVLEDYASHCEEHPELCFNCKSNGCNTITEAKDFQTCLSCDASNSRDCLLKPQTVTSTRKCVEGCISSLYTRKSNPLVKDFVRACFEDIEDDDKVNCTKENNCIKCIDGDKCNTDILPKEGRLSCFHCSGDNCHLPEKRTCLGYSDDYQCYMFFDKETFSVIEAGCRNDLPVDQIEGDVKQYFICDGDNCNSYENLPDGNRCFVCNSETDENCAINPTKIKGKKLCQNYPYTECYSRIASGGHTERGCFYNLPQEDFVKCREGDVNTICKICAQSDCNNAIYPGNRRRCQRCNSAEDPTCQSNPASSQVCPLYAADDVCVTKLIDGVTHRGCRSELSCDGSSNKNCRTCEGNNCNTIDISAVSIGDPGMFQDLPLNCHHCDGKEECASSLGVVRKCEGNAYQTCTVAFDKSGSVVKRGCSEDLDAECSNDGNICYDCKSNGCNEAREQSEFIDCVFCDARQGEDCVFEVNAITRKRQCYKSCLTALYPRSKDPEPVLELVRTCLDDMDLDDREECAAGVNGNCKVCNSSNCNIDDLGVRKSCYHCSGENCQNPVVKTCRAVLPGDQCFIEYDENRSPIEMGCKSKYDAQDVKTLLVAKRLWLCDDDNCNDIENAPTAQRCTICNSRTDANCAIDPEKVQSDTNCARLPFTSCYTRVFDDGHTERGCLSNLEDEQFYDCLTGQNLTQCIKTCIGENCNKKIYPEDRLTCHACDSESQPDCEHSPNSAQVCLKYSASEQCVSHINAAGETVRGCSSQITCDASDPNNCQVCDGSNCNVSNLKRKSDGKPGIWQDLPLSCQSCSSVEDCATNSQSGVCENHEDYCMTVFNGAGSVQKRGCSSDVESEFASYCNSNSQNCFNCNSNGCNRAGSLSEYVDCIYCDSEIEMDCVANPEKINKRRKCNGGCMTALYLKPNTTVYAMARTCLDDKDEEDRSVCKVGSASDCAACESGANCNTQVVPSNRLSCYTCQGDDCEDDARSEICKYYKENDQCFMLFNGASNVMQLGCLSDLEDEFVANNRHLLHLCEEGSNCNGWENLPKAQLCLECDSKVDGDCAADPANVPLVTNCATLPNTQCFTQLYTDGSTKRGCVSSLTQSQMINCLSGNSDACSVCSGDTCNKEIFPANRRRCHRCNSKEDPTCEDSPDASSACPFYSATDFCSVKLVNGYTYRGCASEFTCDESDFLYCRMCKDQDNCNSIDLVKSNIGYPGKWQDVPLNCYTCEGDECASGLGIVRKCENNDQQVCGSVFDATSGKVVQRGCSDKIFQHIEHSSYCSGNPDNCKFCKSNGCNVATSLSDYVDCIFCDAMEDENCIRDVSSIKRTRTCHKKCMTGLYPRVAETNPAYELARGCLDDLDVDEREACENGDSKLCKVCDGAACNIAAIPETPRLKCNKCNGSSNCKAPTSGECLSYRDDDQCYSLFYEDEVIGMGCASDLDNSILVAKRRNLLLCHGDNCNTKESFPKPISCSICNSSSDIQCAISPSQPSLAAVCQDLPYSQCYTRIDKDGLTLRGCLSDVPDDVFDECIKDDENGSCQICDSNNCNTKLFPENRRSCNRCDSFLYPNCEDSPQDSATVCPLYVEGDSCVTKIEGSRTLRGCLSDFSCDSSDPKTCRICNGDNCNSINLLGGFVGEPGKWQDLPLNCYVCEGEGCSSGFGSVHKCEGNNLQTCVSVFAPDGSSVQKRGCSDSIEVTHQEFCENNPDKCLNCKSNGCNNVKSLNDLTDCYFCDSSEGRRCSVNFNEGTRTRKCQGGCMVALYPRSSSEDPAYELSRSCLDDMDLDEREKCEADEMENCKACTGSRCNTMDLPEKRHSCFQCQGEDECENFEAQSCNSYHPNDQCYILYDKSNSISAMGCRSEYEMEAITELVKQKRLIVCDGENCNSPEIVQTKTCIVCNSAEDPRCASNPNLIENSARCAAAPYTDCVTRVDSDGHTIRGCLSSLPSEEFYGCLRNNDTLCITCSTNNCNGIDIFPANRMRCHQCDSKTNPLCSSSPDSNRACPIYDPSDSCVSNLFEGITHRGCASSFKCFDESDKRNCRTCNTSGCNVIDLTKKGKDGEPGKWQEVPLTCHHCVDEEDCAKGSIYNVCSGNPYQNCMTVFNVAGKVIQRGCSESIEAANAVHCAANPDLCLGCNSHGCNEATDLNDYVECIVCDTDENENGDCVGNVSGVTETRKCYKECMTAMYPRDKEENPAYHLTRSCLDDMDLDDREICNAGEKEYCESCSGDKCNTKALPEQRLSCHTCQGDACQLPESKTCPLYREDDQCYALYDETRSVIALGCRSEFRNDEANYLFKQKRLYLCDGDNCNDLESLPKTQSCTICSSRTDLACATNPETLNTFVSCNVAPFTECYSRVLTDGSTERGCLSNLYDDEFIDCVSGNSSKCEACKGDSCNTKIYPSGRASCHICDSSFDPACEARPNNLAICPKYDAEDTCVTVYRNGVTQRGCSSSLSCDGSGSRGCSKCSGDGCNTVNLAKKQDDNFGKWQDLPLRCYVCQGSECEKDLSADQIETCQNNNEQDCLVIFDENDKVIERGCSDAVDEHQGSYCDEHGDLCFNCKSNECNIALSKNEYTECVYCDSYKDLSCLWQPESNSHRTRMCRGVCMTALYPTDSAKSPAYDLIRTCLDDKESKDQTTCSIGGDPNCKACTSDNCNTEDLPENRSSCLHCSGEDCEDPQPMKCPLYKKEEKCYIYFDNTNSVNEMGCVSSFRNQELESLIKTKRIYICDDGENCNQLDRLNTTQKCAVCNSKEDSLCAVNAKAVGTFDECSMLPYTGCYSKLNEDGSTVRGCLTDLPQDNFASCVLGKDELCEPCSGDSCNREIFPADRQQCYTCTSEDDSACESFPSLMLPCPVVNAGESCATALSGNVTIRGCSSEVYCDAGDRSSCRSCFGTSCNSIDLYNKVDDGNHGAWQPLPLRCHSCVGDHCKASLGPIETCTRNDLQDCMTVFGANGEVRRRGCSDDVEDYEDLYCRLHPELCFKCKSNECNIAWDLNEYIECAYCNSTTNIACAISPETSSFANRKCYKGCMITMHDDDEVIRSCLDDKEIFSQTTCRLEDTNGKDCTSCDGGHCNTFIYPRDRLKCHICTDSACTNSVAQYCLKYKENDFCFAKYENGIVDRMGCGSSQNASDIDQWTIEKKLYRCNSNDCNDVTKLPSIAQCAICDSSKTPACAQNPSAVNQFKTCNSPVDQCATFLDTDGHTKRGCFGQLDAATQAQCTSGRGNCALCTGNNCNNEIFPVDRRRCHICNSVSDPNCRSNPNSAQICPIYDPSDRCVTKLSENSFFERGCASQLQCDEKDQNTCVYCATDLCNIHQLTNAAIAFSASLLLTMLLTSIATFGFFRH